MATATKLNKNNFASKDELEWQRNFATIKLNDTVKTLTVRYARLLDNHLTAI